MDASQLATGGCRRVTAFPKRGASTRCLAGLWRVRNVSSYRILQSRRPPPGCRVGSHGAQQGMHAGRLRLCYCPRGRWRCLPASPPQQPASGARGGHGRRGAGPDSGFLAARSQRRRWRPTISLEPISPSRTRVSPSLSSLSLASCVISPLLPPNTHLLHPLPGSESLRLPDRDCDTLQRPTGERQWTHHCALAPSSVAPRPRRRAARPWATPP